MKEKQLSVLDIGKKEIKLSPYADIYFVYLQNSRDLLMIFYNNKRILHDYKIKTYH